MTQIVEDIILTPTPETSVYAVTGTFHGSLVEARTEGEARRIFHRVYNGESILTVKKRQYSALLV